MILSWRRVLGKWFSRCNVEDLARTLSCSNIVDRAIPGLNIYSVSWRWARNMCCECLGCEKKSCCAVFLWLCGEFFNRANESKQDVTIVCFSAGWSWTAFPQLNAIITISESQTNTSWKRSIHAGMQASRTDGEPSPLSELLTHHPPAPNPSRLATPTWLFLCLDFAHLETGHHTKKLMHSYRDWPA